MVETYLNKELADLTFDISSLDEWKKTCEELGLENQLNLTKGKSSPIPYPHINTVMQRVYETLCPTKVDYKQFRTTPIPLEALREIALSVNDKHFMKIEIWSDNKSPDPIAVGIAGYYYCYDKNYNNAKDENGDDIRFNTDAQAKKYKEENGLHSTSYTETGKYLIARWGDELRDFATLKQMAIERFLDNTGGELKREIATKTEKLKLLRENTVSYFNGNISESEVTG